MSLRAAPALLVLLAACSRPAADGPACPHEGAPDRARVVSVSHSPLKAALRRDLSLDELARLGEGVGTGRLQGLTVVDHSFERKWARTITSSRKPGRMCVWLTKFTVDLSPSRAEVFVPREYPDGSCEETEVMRHEREHEEAHRVSLAEFSDRLARDLAAADWLPVEGAPLEVADEAEADRRMEAAFDRIFLPARAAFMESLRERNAVLDLPENYRWVTARCRGWK
ncbi:MAG: hypothetical protein SF051_03855 [Elusimicrobiota bacterium]|nr:hypothetical protein [Elusimicrobiota bacterium]